MQVKVSSDIIVGGGGGGGGVFLNALWNDYFGFRHLYHRAQDYNCNITCNHSAANKNQKQPQILRLCLYL